MMRLFTPRVRPSTAALATGLTALGGNGTVLSVRFNATTKPPNLYEVFNELKEKEKKLETQLDAAIAAGDQTSMNHIRQRLTAIQVGQNAWLSAALSGTTLPRGSVSVAVTAATRPNCLEAQPLIPTRNPKKMVASTLQFTHVGMPFHGRDEVMQQVDDRIKVFSSPTQLKQASCNKTRPIIGTAATSGAGKSRLMHEIRSAYEKKGFIVLVVNYNSLDGFEPTAAEKNKSDTVKEAFLNRLVSGMLAPDDFNKNTMTRRFDVSDDEVATLICNCFPKKKILILVDEVGQLQKEDCMNEAISAAGTIADEVSQKNNAECISFVAASQKLLDDAMNMTKRHILMVDLPLLPREAVKALVKKKAPTASESKLERATDFIFAITAGHPRSIAWFYYTTWKNGLPKEKTTLEGVILDIAGRPPVYNLTEEIVIALLGGKSDGVDFADLSSKGIVYQEDEKRWKLVPAFLFAWADQGHCSLAEHLKQCLLAAWEGVFAKDEKRCTPGLALERLLRHYEVVRREVVGTDETTIAQFLCVPSDAVPRKWQGPVRFPPITWTEELTQPRSKKWKDFEASSLKFVCDPTELYFPGSHSPNFPLYDWFTVATRGTGEQIRIGGQCKPRGGKTNAPDPDTLSVFFTTESSPPPPSGDWIVMNRERVMEYLGPTIAAAASCQLLRPPARGDDQSAGKKKKKKKKK